MKFSFPVSTALVLFLSISSCTPFENNITDRSGGSTSRISSLASVKVNCMAMDSKNLLWIGTNKNIVTFDGTNYRYFAPSKEPSRLPSGTILCMLSDHNQTVWFGTGKGLCRYLRYSRFETIPFEDGRDRAISSIVETSDNVLIIRSECDYYYLDGSNTLRLIPSLHQSSDESEIIPDDNGGVWIATLSSLDHYDRHFGEISHIDIDSESGSNICMVRQDGNIWALQADVLSCFDVNDGAIYYSHKGKGLTDVDFIFYEAPNLLLKSEPLGLVSFSVKNFQLSFDDRSFINSIQSASDLTCMFKDPIGNIWMGYEHFGVQSISPEQKETLKLNDNLLHYLTTGRYIKSLSKGVDDTVWGNNDQDVFCYHSYTDKLDLFTGVRAASIQPDGNALWLTNKKKIDLSSVSGSSLRIDKTWSLNYEAGNSLALDGQLYVTSDSPYLYRFSTSGKCDSLRVDAEKYDKNSKIIDIGDGRLLMFGAISDCLNIDTQYFKASKFEITFPDEQNETGGQVVDAVKDGREVYLSLSDGGLFCLDLDDGSMRQIKDLAELTISSIFCYSDKLMVFGSSEGVVFYDRDNSAVRVFNVNLRNGTVSSYTPSGIVRGQNSIILGSGDGCVFVSPNTSTETSDHFASVHMVSVLEGGSSKVVHLPQDESSCVFNYKHNSFSIALGLVNYDKQPVKMQYMLEGYNQDWTDVTDRVTFSRIPAGHYVFRLREVQPYTTRVVAERQMKVIVKKPFWATVPAILIYILLAAGLIFMFSQIIYIFRTKEMALNLAEEKSDLERRTNLMNMAFFANITHEFRNPLTIISGPLVSLVKDESLSESAHKKVMAISASANTMLRLIDQMLDFNQLEMDVLKLCVGEHDVTYELAKMADIFQESASTRDISVSCDGLEEPFVTVLDMDKFEKIVDNLFTNALKHTPDNGSISISFDDITSQEAQEAFPDAELKESRYFRVDIKNSGKPIQDDKLDNVFKRYYQTNEANATHDYGWGRGIGLYYVERLVNVHNGAIKVANVPDGVCFSFVIPTDSEIYAGTERESANTHRILQIEMPKPAKPKSTESISDAVNRPTILVVDDDIQIGQYVRSLFEDEYRVVNKYSAEAALQDFEVVHPDIVISDVVMGKMSGYDFCRQIKSDMKYSHIPFILLTAKTDVEDSVSGLNCGANAYVTKPFSAEYFCALVASQLKNIENIKASLNTSTEASMVDGDLCEQDRNFINDLYRLMEKHLSEADLSVTTVCEELKISRSKFNYKLKGLTGSSPGTFFRQYKLNLAAKMLKEGRYNVSEISDMMGFASISNFSASFKRMFGVAPRDYK